MKAAVYIRVSTEEQAKEGFSIAAQEEKLLSFACSQGWTVAGMYIDEGCSAKNTDRPQLQHLLADVRAGMFDVVLVYRLDRLTRSVLDLYQLLQEFERYGVRFRSCTEVYDTTTAIGRLFITLVAALAQWERENLAERVKLGMGQVAREQKRPGGPPPFGYDLQEGRLIVNEREAEIVRQIFANYLAGWGLQRIAEQMNLIGWRGKTGARWSQTTLSHLLQNHAYYGALRWNYAEGGQKINPPEHWIVKEDSHPAIIDKETFFLAQKLLSSRRRKHPRELASDFIFSGVLHCARCGAAMYGKTGTTKSRHGKVYTNRYYLCKNRKGKTCRAPSIREDLLESAFVPHLFSCLADGAQPEAVFRKSKKREPAADGLRRQLAGLEAKRFRLDQAYSEALLPLEHYRLKLEEIDRQQAALLEQLEQKNQHPQLTEQQQVRMLRDISLVWSYATKAEKKHLVSVLVERIDAEAEGDKSAAGSPAIYRPVLLRRLAFR
jgi:site-specific DNA recombinase